MPTSQTKDLFPKYAKVAQAARGVVMKILYPPGAGPAISGTNAQLGFIAGVLSRFSANQQTAFDSGSVASSATGVANLMERQVQRALSQVMGRSPNSPDTFISALNDTFPANGNGLLSSAPSRSVVSMYSSNSPDNNNVITTGLAGQLSVEQANLYRQASVVSGDAMQVLRSLQPFAPEAELDRVEALRSMILYEVKALLEDFGRVDEPRSERVEAYFESLLGSKGKSIIVGFPTDKIAVGGHLAKFGKAALLDRTIVAATTDDESMVAGFELLKNYINILHNVWEQYRALKNSVAYPLFSERLARANTMLSVLSDGTNQFKSAMDSIGFTENERRSVATMFTMLSGYGSPYGAPPVTYPVDFSNPATIADLSQWLPSMTVNDLTDWLDQYATIDGQEFLATGQYGLELVTEQADKLFWTIAPIVGFVKTTDISNTTNKPILVQALLHERVTWALDDIMNQLNALADLAA